MDYQPGFSYRHPNNGLPLFAQTDNLRYEHLPHCRVQYLFLCPLPTTPRHLGVQSQGPLLLLILGQTESDVWRVEGALTQERHIVSWHLGLPGRPGHWADFRMEFTWMGGTEEVVRAGCDDQGRSAKAAANFRRAADRGSAPPPQSV